MVCPGSRSTPLTIAFASHAKIVAIPVLDERSAGFFALGRAKKTGLPTALVCTSGTAGANFYPAAIEATESGIPLIILTADRPPELRNCHAGQTIDQLKLYGNYPNWQCELALPEANLAMLRYLRQNAIQAWQRSLFPTPGVVHLNIPLRKPLAPIERSLGDFEAKFLEDFFDTVTELNTTSSTTTLPWDSWQGKKGIIIAGLAQPQDPSSYCQAIALLSQQLFFPVLAEALSPLRNYAQLNPYLISTYDLILRQQNSELIPEVVIQIGELPTSKELRAWLGKIDVRRWIIDARIDNLDPLHGKTIQLHTSVEQIFYYLKSNFALSPRCEARDAEASPVVPREDTALRREASPLGHIARRRTTQGRELNSRLASSRSGLTPCPLGLSPYCQRWSEWEAKTRSYLDNTLASLDKMYEGKAAWLISQSLPLNTPIFLANSMSVRNAEYFWQPNNTRIIPYFSRGANGIDGTLSTALGIAYQSKGVLLTGDLALLHDTNGFLIQPKFAGHLTIIVINNSGGGIFEMLPIADFPLFEEYFATPQSVDLARLCSAYGVKHQKIDSWQQLEHSIRELPTTGIRVLELICDRHTDAAWLKNLQAQFEPKPD